MKKNLDIFDSTKNYDALILLAGEISPRNRPASKKNIMLTDEDFPVTSRAVKLFESGKFGCMFVSGGYDGFAKKEEGPGRGITDAEYTVDFLKRRGVPQEKIFYDKRSYETAGSLTFPTAEIPVYGNPTLNEFDSMLIIEKEGKLRRIRDYANLIFENKNEINYYPIRGVNSNNMIAKAYHTGLMSALHSLGWKPGAEAVHYFLKNDHPFYSKGWFDKSPLVRKAEMSAKALSWWAIK